MSDLVAVMKRFPMHELTIRRLYLRVPEFRGLCEDYATARCALEHWRADETKGGDFQRLAEEIETEIEEFIERSLQAVKPQSEKQG